MAKLYSNENFPLPVVEELRRLGHDVLTIQETGKAGQAIKDEVVLEYAVADDRALLTLNRRHFIQLYGERPAHDGIMLHCFRLGARHLGLAPRVGKAPGQRAVKRR